MTLSRVCLTPARAGKRQPHTSFLSGSSRSRQTAIAILEVCVPIRAAAVHFHHEVTVARIEADPCRVPDAFASLARLLGSNSDVGDSGLLNAKGVEMAAQLRLTGARNSIGYTAGESNHQHETEQCPEVKQRPYPNAGGGAGVASLTLVAREYTRSMEFVRNYAN